MILGTGIDLLKVSRIKKLLDNYGDIFVKKVLQDPLHEKNILPNFAHTLNLTHWSPTSLGMSDGSFSFKY